MLQSLHAHRSAVVLFALALLAVVLPAEPSLAQPAKPELLLYCGITMVRPMTEIAQNFEKRENLKLTIAQGGSDDLYQSLKKSGVGDLYLPGEPSFRDRYLAEGLLGEYRIVGYNQMALMVQKGNPKKVKGDPKELLRKDLAVIIGNAASGSVGKETQTLLEGLGLYQKVLEHAIFLAPDSRSLVNTMKKGEADIAMNWRAVGFFPDNAAWVDVVDLSPKLAQPQALQLTLVKSSKYPELARRFIAYAAGEEGQAIFRKHGFLDNQAMDK